MYLSQEEGQVVYLPVLDNVVIDRSDRSDVPNQLNECMRYRGGGGSQALRYAQQFQQTGPYDTALLSTQMFSNFLFEAADCSARHFFVCLREQKEGLRKLWEMNDVC